MIVGPGFENALLPAYPTNPEGFILENDFKGRELVELDFEDLQKWKLALIGSFRAIDYLLW